MRTRSGAQSAGTQIATLKFSRGPICRQGAQSAGARFAGARFAGAQFAAPKISGAQFAAPKIFRGPICRTQNFLGPNLPPWGPICRGPICRGPICRQGAQSAGARFAKKWQIGPQKVRGPICRQIGAGPNLPGPNLPGPNLPRTSTYIVPDTCTRLGYCWHHTFLVMTDMDPDRQAVWTLSTFRFVNELKASSSSSSTSRK